jgi:hypothetical protein
MGIFTVTGMRDVVGGKRCRETSGDFVTVTGKRMQNGRGQGANIVGSIYTVSGMSENWVRIR